MTDRRRSTSLQWLIVIVAAIPTTLASIGALIATLRAPDQVAKAVVAAQAPPATPQTDPKKVSVSPVTSSTITGPCCAAAPRLGENK